MLYFYIDLMRAKAALASPKRDQEPITRSVQLAYFLATAFSEVGLSLDEAFFCGYILHITVNCAISADY